MTTSPDQPLTLTIRHEVDVLALVPFVLGFHPEDSLVLLTTSTAGAPFHARIDLPDDPADLEYVVEHLVDAVRRNRTDKAVVVAYTADVCLAEAATDLLADRLAAESVPVAVALRADEGRWFRLGEDGPGEPYDVQSHPFTAHGVLDGRVTYPSRRALEDSLVAHDPTSVDEVADALSVARPPRRGQAAAEAAWCEGLLEHAEQGLRSLAADEVARLVMAVGVLAVRDKIWGGMTRQTALLHVELWREVVRRCPVEHLAPPAALLAFSAWLAGDGALAWCAVDRAREADPDYTLTDLVARALDAAMPPSEWEHVGEDVRRNVG